MPNCNKCSLGERYSNDSDICDSCRHDPDTGWGGFTDHKLGRHFYTEEERESYEEHYASIQDDRTDDDL